MLFFLTSILSLTAIAADFIHFRRRRRRKRPVRRALVAWVAATDALLAAGAQQVRCLTFARVWG